MPPVVTMSMGREDPLPGDNVLGRVTDPTALDAEKGPVALLTISAPRAWQEGRVALQVPRVLTCAACSGGGCDACGRSGAVEAPAEAARRRIELQLPRVASPPVAVRVPRPFGAASTITQLLVVVEEGPADRRAELLAACARGAEARGPARPFPWVALALAAAAAIGIARWAAG